MKLQFLRHHRQWKPGDLGEVTHEGVANELIRRGLAHEFIETPADPESAEGDEAESETAAEPEENQGQHDHHGKKRKRKG